MLLPVNDNKKIFQDLNSSFVLIIMNVVITLLDITIRCHIELSLDYESNALKYWFIFVMYTFVIK